MHVTCAAHLLHNCAIRVRAHFKNIDEVIATITAATIKNKNRKKNFHYASLPSPPVPVITRWANWLRAAFCSYHCQQLDKCRPVVSRAKDVINVEDLVPDLVKINHYRTPANVEFLKGSAGTITEAYGMLKNMQIRAQLKITLKKRLFNSDLETIINCTNSTIDPTSYALLQKAQPNLCCC